MFNNGISDYLSDFGNWIDCLYIGGSIAMTINHSNHGPLTPASKFFICLVGALAFRRTMGYLRIFNSFTPIVTMLTNVIWELRFFFTFYYIECFLFSLMLGVLGVGNWKIEGKYKENWFV